MILDSMRERALFLSVHLFFLYVKVIITNELTYSPDYKILHPDALRKTVFAIFLLIGKKSQYLDGQPCRCDMSAFSFIVFFKFC